ncbi:MAG: DUF1850 domain-containing protein [Armatimonadota bacterium]|nr:DUF1850 domain-containing protein [Armatimonadota bacterium]
MTLTAATLLVGSAGLEIVVTSTDGRRLHVPDVQAGERIELRYRHSVERTPVIEIFRAERDGLWFEEMWFVSHGAGLPTAGYTREGGRFVLRERKRIGDLPLMVATTADQRLQVAGREIPLAAFGEGARVSVSVRHTGRALRWPWER